MLITFETIQLRCFWWEFRLLGILIPNRKVVNVSKKCRFSAVAWNLRWKSIKKRIRVGKCKKNVRCQKLISLHPFNILVQFLLTTSFHDDPKTENSLRSLQWSFMLPDLTFFLGNYFISVLSSCFETSFALQITDEVCRCKCGVSRSAINSSNFPISLSSAFRFSFLSVLWLWRLMFHRFYDMPFAFFMNGRAVPPCNRKISLSSFESAQ